MATSPSGVNGHRDPSRPANDAIGTTSRRIHDETACHPSPSTHAAVGVSCCTAAHSSIRTSPNVVPVSVVPVSVLPLIVLSALLSATAAHAEARVAVVQDLSPLARAEQISERLLSPTTHDRLTRYLAATGRRAREHTIVAGEEQFDLYVPSQAPTAGYGVLVFVPPVARFAVPAEWTAVLDDAGIIYIAARRSGNRQDTLDRRIPLALHAYEHVRTRYRLDPQRVFVSGFSGGSRVAQRIAVGYPDVFRGVLLIGGSDPIGADGFPPAPRALMQLFQSRSRVVFATGGDDHANRGRDASSRRVMQTLCVQGLSQVPQLRVGHWIPPAHGFARALTALQQPVPRSAALEPCRARLDAAIDRALRDVERLLAAGDVRQAGKRLGALDDRYGGLAPPRVIELARRISAALDSGDADH